MNIYDLKLHEGEWVDTDEESIWVIRVPGGWIYYFEYPVFVPYHPEFKPKVPSANETI